MYVVSVTWSFNRTFMELKSMQVHKALACETVLIVPLWNWNVVDSDQEFELHPVLIVPLWNWNSPAATERRNILS